MNELLKRLSEAFAAAGVRFKDINGKIGKIDTLNTTDKSSLTAALNEVLTIAQNAGGSGGLDEATVNAKVTAAISALKAELLGGASEDYDTLKEIIDYIQQLEGDNNIKSAILAKFTEQANRIKAIEDVLNTDFAAIITAAEGA